MPTWNFVQITLDFKVTGSWLLTCMNLMNLVSYDTHTHFCVFKLSICFSPFVCFHRKAVFGKDDRSAGAVLDTA